MGGRFSLADTSVTYLTFAFASAQTVNFARSSAGEKEPKSRFSAGLLRSTLLEVFRSHLLWAWKGRGRPLTSAPVTTRGSSPTTARADAASGQPSAGFGGLIPDSANETG